MSLNGIDDILDEDNFLSNETWEKILEAVIRAYSIVIIEREKEGNFYTGFSRREYMKYKREEDPHYRTIESFLGNWSVVKNILPVESKTSRQKFYEDGLTEKQLADRNGLKRIWDCGKIRYTMKIE